MAEADLNAASVDGVDARKAKGQPQLQPTSTTF